MLLRKTGVIMSKSVCIVGAGPSGLVAAKTLLHDALPGEYKVSVFDVRDGIGGLWPTSRADTSRQIHPLMVANQSKHTMHFSDQAWEPDAPQMPLAWQVGRYLERYMDRYLTSHPRFGLHLRTKVVRAQPRKPEGAGWDVCLEFDGKSETRHFHLVVVASGYFGKPFVPDGVSLSSSPCITPVIHSSQYRDLKSLLGNSLSARGKILVVGGQMSGVEIAGTIATHLSSAAHSPQEYAVAGIDQCSVHHLVQRPIWVFPSYTTAEPKAPAAPFLPLDFSSYNRTNRSLPLVNTQGHVDEKTAQAVHAIFQASLGTDQSVFSPGLCVDDAAKKEPPYLAVSDWYCDFVRCGLISVSRGKLHSVHGDLAKLTDGSELKDIVAVVVATGFDPSPCLSYLPMSTLKALNHSAEHREQPLALAFHGTHHPDVQGLGFVGFYRSPYWGVMQMQARFLAKYWSSSGLSEALKQKLKTDNSVQKTLDLRGDPRLSQFPMGDYPFLMQEFSEALSIPRADPSLSGVPNLPHNHLPLDMLTPSRYPSAYGDEDSEKLLQDTVRVAIDGLTGVRFVPRAVFRSLLGTWKLERDVTSRLATHPNGHFSGTAKFLLRAKTPDGCQCAKQGPELGALDDTGLEYLYIEDGEFKTDQGFGFRASRRYIWRYDEESEKLSVWFAKPDDLARADYLFHEIEFQHRNEGGEQGWAAKAGHLCIDDYYDVGYNFAFEAVNLKEWTIDYTVNGPKKDYTIRGKYTR
ncbi:uncharacterized protein UV8b_03597 [Ustilaginoidea virens]|uniref:DUF6314 domain-containing protein n=1 Tax=Ustilaginoidea virens TaxID=1159556 RepID=A0A8E5MH67_USTVR|nr:uncharacterized protein UV8b_03597 [Ustilaginoidea virens]QUC19356.1 hypothetical protein UV8b_03597 [Ustilaginoidea virens]